MKITNAWIIATQVVLLTFQVICGFHLADSSVITETYATLGFIPVVMLTIALLTNQ